MFYAGTVGEENAEAAHIAREGQPRHKGNIGGQLIHGVKDIRENCFSGGYAFTTEYMIYIERLFAPSHGDG